MDEFTDTKKGLRGSLQTRMKEIQDQEPNPFVESRMVFYILNGLNALEQLEANEDDTVIMYDENDTLKFRVEA